MLVFLAQELSSSIVLMMMNNLGFVSLPIVTYFIDSSMMSLILSGVAKPSVPRCASHSSKSLDHLLGYIGWYLASASWDGKAKTVDKVFDRCDGAI